MVSMTDRWDEAEFEALFREQYARIVRVIRRIVQRDSEAEEICSEVFLRLYRSGPRAAADGMAGAWLYRTATRASIDLLRARRRQQSKEVDENDGSQAEDPAEDALTLLLRQERIGAVREVLARMKVERAQLLLLRHSGLSYQELAQAMQVHMGSVGTKLARAEAEFTALYQRCQRRQQKTPQLQTAKEEGR